MLATTGRSCAPAPTASWCATGRMPGGRSSSSAMRWAPPTASRSPLPASRTASTRSTAPAWISPVPDRRLWCSRPIASRWCRDHRRDAAPTSISSPPRSGRRALARAPNTADARPTQRAPAPIRLARHRGVEAELARHAGELRAARASAVQSPQQRLRARSPTTLVARRRQRRLPRERCDHLPRGARSTPRRPP